MQARACPRTQSPQDCSSVDLCVCVHLHSNRTPLSYITKVYVCVSARPTTHTRCVYVRDLMRVFNFKPHTHIHTRARERVHHTFSRTRRRNIHKHTRTQCTHTRTCTRPLRREARHVIFPQGFIIIFLCRSRWRFCCCCWLVVLPAVVAIVVAVADQYIYRGNIPCARACVCVSWCAIACVRSGLSAAGPRYYSM